MQNGGHGFRAGIAFEGALPTDHFVQNAAEAENVGQVIRGFAANLFRGHVSDGPENDTDVGFGGGHAVDGFGQCVRTAQFGQSEIEDFQASVFGDENVFGFQVAMRDVLVMGSGEAVGQLHG